MSRVNWSADRNRQRLRRQGAEDVRDEVPIMGPLIRKKPFKPKVSKNALRQEADRALQEWKRAHDD